MHPALFALAARGDRDLLRAVARLAALVYAHVPMIVGVVLFAFAMKKIIGHVDDELESVAAFALCGRSALYLLTYSAIRMRIERRLALDAYELVWRREARAQSRSALASS